MKLTINQITILACLITLMFASCKGDTTSKQEETTPPKTQASQQQPKPEAATAASNTPTQTEGITATPKATPEPEAATPEKKTRPTVNINPNDKISSPAAIEVNSEGLWIGFEGELGTVTLIDEGGKSLGLGILSTTDNWMTKEPVIFKTTLKFKADKPGTGKLVFKKNNPAGPEGKDKSFEIPVRYE